MCRSPATMGGDCGRALGLLGWEFKDGNLQTKGGLFPWHDESLRELFDRPCEEGVDRVQEELEKS